jgi:hypothetical protein
MVILSGLFCTTRDFRDPGFWAFSRGRSYSAVWDFDFGLTAGIPEILR